MGLDPQGLEFESYSVPEVTEELRNQTGPSFRLVVSSSSGKLKIMAPSALSLKEVHDRARSLGDKAALSRADASVLALALDLRKEGKSPVIVSDDYAVQNVAEGEGLAYQPLATFGIRHKFTWVYHCPACGKRYPAADVDVCPVCGTKLKRRPVRKQAVKKLHPKA